MSDSGSRCIHVSRSSCDGRQSGRQRPNTVHLATATIASVRPGQVQATLICDTVSPRCRQRDLQLHRGRCGDRNILPQRWHTQEPSSCCANSQSAIKMSPLDR